MNKRILVEISLFNLSYLHEFYFNQSVVTKICNIELLCYNLYKLDIELNFLNNSIQKKHTVAYGITSMIAANILIELFKNQKINKIINPKMFIESINVYSKESIDIQGSRSVYDIITEVYLEKFDIKKINF